MKIRTNLLFLLCSLCTIAYSCSEAEIKLSNKDMDFARTLANVQMARSSVDLIESGDRDSARRVLISKALALTDMDTLTFYAQMQYYGQDPLRLKVIYDSSLAMVSRQKLIKENNK